MSRGASPVLLHEPQARALAGYAHMFTLRRTIRRSRPSGGKANFASSFSAENNNSSPLAYALWFSTFTVEDKCHAVGPQRAGHVSCPGGD